MVDFIDDTVINIVDDSVLCLLIGAAMTRMGSSVSLGTRVAAGPSVPDAAAHARHYVVII